MNQGILDTFGLPKNRPNKHDDLDRQLTRDSPQDSDSEFPELSLDWLYQTVRESGQPSDTMRRAHQQ